MRSSRILRIPTSMVSEAYSAIVAALRFSTEDRDAEGLAGHQHAVGRGQVVVGAGASRRISRGASKAVLLIDSDLRKPAFKAADEGWA